MAPAPLTELEIENILGASMRIEAPINWNTKESNSWCEAILNVYHPRRDVRLEVRINFNTSDPEKFSISLLLWGHFRIRGLDVNGSHENRHTDQNQWIQELHKHKWADRCHGKWAYTPDGIRTYSLKKVFEDFCQECGIIFDGKWIDPPPHQIDLEIG